MLSRLLVQRAALAWPCPWSWGLHAVAQETGSRGLTGTWAEPADPCRLRPFLPADPKAVVRGTAEYRPLLDAITTGHRALQVESR